MPLPGEGGQLTVGFSNPAEEGPPSTRRWTTEVVGRESRQGRRNDTAPIEDDPSVGDVVRGFGETATPHRSKPKQPGQLLETGG